MKVRLAKIRRDLLLDRWRFVLLIAAIAVGTLAVAATLGARAILTREVERSFLAANPPALIVRGSALGQRELEIVEAIEGVAGASLRRVIRAQVEVAPGNWQPAMLFSVPSFQEMKVSSLLSNRDGRAKPGQVLLERSSLPLFQSYGNQVRMRFSGGRERIAEVAEVVHDPALAPGWQDHVVYAYWTSETAASFGQPGNFDEIRVAVYGQAELQVIARRIGEAIGHDSIEQIEAVARRHPHADHMDTMLLIFSFFGGLALVAAGALAANLVAALMAREIRWIGVMKVSGASNRQVAGLYFIEIAALASLGVAIGLPSGMLLGGVIAEGLSPQLNLLLQDKTVPIGTWATSVAAGLLVPIIAAMWPILRIAGRTVLGLLHAEETPGLRRPWPAFGSVFYSFALRNAFRKPLRLGLTLFALAIGGAACMIAVNVNRALVSAVHNELANRRDNLDIRLAKPVSLRLADLDLPDAVVAAEIWNAALVSVELDGETGISIGSERYGLVAPPSDSRMFRPMLSAGRWVNEGSAEVVINSSLLAREPALAVGSTATLVARGRRHAMLVVGIIDEIAPPAFYSGAATFENLLQYNGRTSALRLIVRPETADHVRRQTEEKLVAAGGMPVFSMSKEDLRKSMTEHFQILLVVLTGTGIAATIVGGIGLTTTLLLNVRERRRELGIMRVLGANPSSLYFIVMAEALTIALCSAGLASLLSIPATYLMTQLVGEYGLHVPVPMIVSSAGTVAWSALAALLALLASAVAYASLRRQTIIQNLTV